MTDAIGIDTSTWNDDPNTTRKPDFAIAEMQGCSFAIPKASQNTWTDRIYKDSLQSILSTDMIPGSYHFDDYSKGINSQIWYYADLYNKMVAENPDRAFLPPDLDCEPYPKLGALPPPATYCHRIIIAGKELKRKTNRKPMLYTSKGVLDYITPLNYQAKLNPQWYQDWCELPSVFDLHIANYNNVTTPATYPFKTYVIWQYSSKGDGRKYGMDSQYVDLNRFNGDKAALYNYAKPGASATIPQPEPEPTPAPQGEYMKGKFAISGLRIRNAPVSGTIIGSSIVGETIEILETKTYSNGDIWIRIGYKKWCAEKVGATVYVTRI
jgi:GH25 family lysozyme M1 (1,4-beta-N-acetylmuramidase)